MWQMCNLIGLRGGCFCCFFFSPDLFFSPMIQARNDLVFTKNRPYIMESILFFQLVHKWRKQISISSANCFCAKNKAPITNPLSSQSDRKSCLHKMINARWVFSGPFGTLQNPFDVPKKRFPQMSPKGPRRTLETLLGPVGTFQDLRIFWDSLEVLGAFGVQLGPFGDTLGPLITFQNSL